MTYPEGFEPPTRPPTTPPPETIRVQDAARPLFEAKGWMKLLAVVSIGGGALYALTIVGIIFAWLPIWIGVLLWQSAGAAEDAHATGSSDRLLASQAKLKTLFTLYGIVTLVGLILAIIAIIVLGGAIITGVRQGFSV
ncbi:hypothetical protein BMS3Abin02_01930 [bacterium BMS3Abin02]|nr:hypothetical protein BMS3Abin02_01930 [bacterium BMS3Abin02]GBE22058.1 hypothetical protein BMS3Bbin01_01420 [bacterium BMS3Bbin01]HDH26833.1 hypothetical protein [Actinomycetota bacterium]HDK44994.1 hypothetical protein [Actinomycetota bacterium]